MDHLAGFAFVVICSVASCSPPPRALEDPSSRDSVLEGDSLSLIQLTFAPTVSSRRSMLLASGTRAWLEDPNLRQRLAKLLMEHGKDGSHLNETSVKAAVNGPLKSEAENILRDEMQKSMMEEASPHEQADRLRHESSDARHREREANHRRKDDEKEDRRRNEEERRARGEAEARRRKELEQNHEGKHEDRRREDSSLTQKAEAEERRRRVKDAAQRQKAEEEAQRRHEKQEQKRREREEESRRREAAFEKRRQAAELEAAKEEVARAAAEHAAAKAESRRQHWQQVAEEAKRKADEQLKIEATAEASMLEAAKEESKWKAQAQDAAEKERRSEEEERAAKMEEAALADAQAAVARREAEAEASRQRAQAEAEAQQKTEAGARQQAEATAAQEAQQEADAEAARQRAEAEAGAKDAAEAQAGSRQKGEAEVSAQKQAEADAEAQQKAEAEAARQKAADALNKQIQKAQQAAAHETEYGTIEEADMAKRLKDKMEVDNILHSWEQARVCVRPDELSATLEESRKFVLKGLPEWQEPEVPSRVSDLTIAFLVQASWEEQLPVLRRAFDRLYTVRDLFLYMVDRERMDAHKVMEVLPSPLPENVVVKSSAHSAYYVWPRVEIVLDGLRTLLLNEKKWDFAIHLSESDYPVHSLNWIRQSLASQRKTNFIQLLPRCWKEGDAGYETKRSEWYWWTQDDALASCGSEIDVTPVSGVKFPLEYLESHGFRFAHGAEWMVVTRELVKYALSPKLLPYRKLVGSHVGADEIFWQTLVLNIPKFKQNVSQQGWYIKWGHGKTDHSPDTLTQSYEEDIMQNRQNLLFARKVSATDSSTLLDNLDKINQGTDSVPGPVERKEVWNSDVVACEPGEAFYEEQEREKVREFPHVIEQGWQGTKSRKQLLESYKWYMQSQ